LRRRLANVRVDPQEYLQLSLRVHGLLRGVELHDVWRAELRGGGSGRSMLDVRRVFTAQTATTANAAVRALFALRTALGRIFGWDPSPARWAGEYYADKLSDEDREQSLVEPGTDDGLFRVVYVFEREALSEVRNATVHAFSCLALRPTMDGYHLYWAIYVTPISKYTSLYMRLIDPFRRTIVYPAVISRLELSWRTMFGDDAPDDRYD